MIYPSDKYKIIVNGTKIIAISTYAGKTVKGVAKADPRDKFDESVGKKLAIARCAAKIAKKRQKRAERKIAEAQRQLDAAKAHYDKMAQYLADAKYDAGITALQLCQYEVEYK